MKKCRFFIIFLLAVFLLPAVSAHANYNNQLPDLKSGAYLLLSADTGAVIFQKNENERLPCADLAKLMTALVVMRHVDDPNTTVQVRSAALEPTYDIDEYTYGLESGEVISVLDLLYIMLVDNGNDAAYVLADVSADSLDAFVSEMNALAEELGCKDTLFTDPAGLNDDAQYTTVNDMMKISRKFVEDPLLAKIGGTGTYTITSSSVKREENMIYNSNDLIYSSEDSYKYAKGTKSGYSGFAKFCLAAYATCDGYTYYCVILKGSTEYEGDGAVAEAKKMFRWAFNNLSMTLVADTDTYISDAPVLMSAKSDRVKLYPKNTVMSLVPDSVDEASLIYQTHINENIKAPIKKGDVLGVCDIVYADEVIATVELVAGESLDRSFFRAVLYFFKTVFTSIIFWGAVAVILVIGASYFFVNRSRDRRELRRIQEITKKKEQAANEPQPHITPAKPVKPAQKPTKPKQTEVEQTQKPQAKPEEKKKEKPEIKKRKPKPVKTERAKKKDIEPKKNDQDEAAPSVKRNEPENILAAIDDEEDD